MTSLSVWKIFFFDHCRRSQIPIELINALIFFSDLWTFPPPSNTELFCLKAPFSNFWNIISILIFLTQFQARLLLWIVHLPILVAFYQTKLSLLSNNNISPQLPRTIFRTVADLSIDIVLEGSDVFQDTFQCANI